MLKLSDRGTVPPGGFKYLNRETQTWVTAASFHELVSAVTRHRTANGLPISSEMDSIVEDQLCTGLPPGTCNHQTEPAFTYKQLNLTDVLAATAMLGKFLIGGRQKVSREEANRRANICASCPANQPTSSCTTCSMNTIRQAVNAVVGGEEVNADSMLGVCAACGCSLKAKVWIPLDLLQQHMTPETLAGLPQWCWCRKAE